MDKWAVNGISDYRKAYAELGISLPQMESDKRNDITSNGELTMSTKYNASETYNGWTNYETWRVNLEILDGMTPEDFGYDKHMLDTADYKNVEKLAGRLEMHVHDLVEMQSSGFALDLAYSFLALVDWEEIAEHMIYDYVNT